MLVNDETLRSILQAELTPAERECGVVYVSAEPVVSGTELQLPRCAIKAPWNALLSFVDGEPLANWGHPCRYILVNVQTGETRSFEARFPPFGSTGARHWRVVYKAPTVPPAAIAVQQ